MRGTWAVCCATVVAACGARTELQAPYDPCALAPSAPQVVVALPAGTVQPAAGIALTVGSGSVLFDTGEGTVDQVPVEEGRLRGDQISSFPVNGKFGGQSLASDSQHVYFADVALQNVVVVAAVGSPLSGTLENPTPPLDNYVISDIAVGGDDNVSWLLWCGDVNFACFGSSVLAHWDGASTVSLATLSDPVFDIVGDTLIANTTTVFVLTRTALVAVGLDGSPPMSLQSFTGRDDRQILGLNDDAIFYSQDGTTIIHHDLASGVETTIASQVALLTGAGAGGHHGWADKDWLYFVTGPPLEGKELRRMPTRGGPSEVIWDAQDHPPTGAVATDACNVYWLTASATWSTSQPEQLDNGPSILMTRRK